MRSPRKKPGPKPWKRVPGVVRRVHRTATEWREILARFGASGQSKTKFCEHNAIARSTFIVWERRLASGDDGSTPGSAAEWFVEVVRSGAIALAEDRLGEAPPATVSPGHLPRIETMWRMVYVLATLDRGDLLADGRGNELDDIVAAARRTMNDTMSEGPG